MPNYNKGCIYMIKHKLDFNNENVYIGSCCNFARRKWGHKSTCNNPNDKRHNIKLYQKIRANGGWDNWVMVRLHNFPCNEKYELNLEERKMIDLYQSKLNMIIPTRTAKEWYEDNKEELSEKYKKYRKEHREEHIEYAKKYYENNKEQINEKQKKYNEEHKEERIEYRKKWYENNKEERNEYFKKYYKENKEELSEKYKKYRENNKEKIKEEHKKWYENNKEKLSEKNKEKIKCECGAIFRKDNIIRHSKSKKHISFFDNMKAN
jgi:hypothetical protein